MKFKVGDKVKVSFTGEVTETDKGTTLPYCVKPSAGWEEIGTGVWVEKGWIKAIKPKVEITDAWLAQVEDHFSCNGERSVWNDDVLALVNEVRKLRRGMNRAFEKLDKRESVTIPEGWNSANEPPDNSRLVEIMDVDAVKSKGIYFIVNKKWGVEMESGICFDAIPIAWREIKKAPAIPDGWQPVNTIPVGITIEAKLFTGKIVAGKMGNRKVLFVSDCDDNLYNIVDIVAWRPLQSRPMPKFRMTEIVVNLSRGLVGHVIGINLRSSEIEYIVDYSTFSAHDPESSLSKVGGV